MVQYLKRFSSISGQFSSIFILFLQILTNNGVV